jgi:hypothetical protein
MIKITDKFMELGVKTFHNESDTFGIHPTDREYLKWIGNQRENGKDINLVNTNSFFVKYFFSDNKFDPKRIDLLKKAGFETITISIESFNEKYNKGKLRGITLNMLDECFKAIKEEKLNIDLYMMYLFPNQTKDELQQDINNVNELSKYIATTTWRKLTYFPGTEYYDWAVRDGKFTEEEYKQWILEGNSFYHTDERFNFSRIHPAPSLPH